MEQQNQPQKTLTLPSSSDGEWDSEWKKMVEDVRWEIFHRLAGLAVRAQFFEDSDPQTAPLIALIEGGIEWLKMAERAAMNGVPRKLQTQAWAENKRAGGGWDTAAKECPAARRMLKISTLLAFAERVVVEIKEENQPARGWPKLPPHRKSDGENP